MSNVPREKIALVVFVGLIAVSLFGLVGYLAVGHSWNVAASNIDDATGQMDGYTAIVFKGTVDPEAAKVKTESKKKDAKAPSGSEAARDAAEDVESGLSGLEDPLGLNEGSEAGENTRADDEESPSRGSGTSDGDSKQGSATDSAKKGDEPKSADDPESGLPSADSSESSKTDSEPSESASSGSSAGSAGSTKKKIPIAIEDVEQSYLDKNATVFSIDAENLGRYREGTILKKGNDRFGIFSVTPKMTKRMIEAQVEYFQTYDVDFIVVLTPDKEIVEDASGIDIAVSTQDEGLFVMGETINGTFYVNAPQIGSVGVILISPSNVVSAKVVQPN